MARTFLKSVAIVILLLFITLGVGRLPLVPPLHVLKSGLSIVFVIISLIVVVANVIKVFRLRRDPGCNIHVLIGWGLAGILWMLISWFVFLEINGVSYLSGTTLKRTVPVPSTSGTIYIYESGTFPDGVDSTRITYSSGWNPFEKKLYATKGVFAAVELDSHYVEVRFMRGNRKRFYLDSLRNLSP